MDAFTPVIAIHAVAALYVILLGPVQILRRRRDRAHRVLGASWVAALLTACLSSFWIVPEGFSWLHGLAIWTLVSMVIAITAIRRRAVAVHRGFMIGSYLGTLAAFAFAVFVPARLIPQLLQSEPLVAVVTVVAVASTVAISVRLATRSPIPRQAPTDLSAIDS